MADYEQDCPNWTLPSGGTVQIEKDFFVVLSHNATYLPACHPNKDHLDHPSVVIGHSDPFYCSVLPQMYAIGMATCIAWLLFIILVITPRTFFIAGKGGGGASFLGRRGMITASYGGASVIGVGGRPWLQKLAALTVAISLSISSAHTFTVAKHQYERHFMDSSSLTQKVFDSTEIRILRVVSTTFLWLAQVQTLIRLFPRHKEKVAIKWIGFALIILDTIFAILNNFLTSWWQNVSSTGNIGHAIPALNYLFELSLSLLYAAWVIFYTISKHRFAFFHPKMRNICLVAVLSLAAVLIPVVFFVLDISKPDISPWGEYIRWVGSAAASVVVWEWVERIEALERDERKDGILGREIFDGDNLLDGKPWQEEVRDGRNDKKGGGDNGRPGSRGSNHSRGGRVTFTNRRPARRKRRKVQGRTGDDEDAQDTDLPTDRTVISSVGSTVYRVRYHTASASEVPPLHEEDEGEKDDRGNGEAIAHAQTSQQVIESGSGDGPERDTSSSNEHTKAGETFIDDLGNDSRTVEQSTTTGGGGGGGAKSLGSRFLSALNIFGRRRTTPPPEIVNAQSNANAADRDLEKGEGNVQSTDITHDDGDTHHLRSLRPFTARNKTALPLTVIPASRASDRRVVRPSVSFQVPCAPERVHPEENPDGLPVVVIPARSRVASRWSSHEGAPLQARAGDAASSATVLPGHEDGRTLNGSAQRHRQLSQHSYHGLDRPQSVHTGFVSLGSQRYATHTHDHDRDRDGDGDGDDMHGNDDMYDDATYDDDDGDELYDREDGIHQVIRVSSPIESLFSDFSTSEGDGGGHSDGVADGRETELHMPIPQSPPLAHRAAAAHNGHAQVQSDGVNDVADNDHEHD
ncbi:pH-response regulator protein palH/rim21 [Ascosphaera atra]|nr:pH-response regulator protein palH/rim21 [Ascosphaera atra]